MGWKAINNRHAEEDRAVVDLCVLAFERFNEDVESDSKLNLKTATNSNLPVAYMNKEDVKVFPEYEEKLRRNDLFVYVRTHPQYVVRVKVDDGVARGFIVLNRLQCANFEVTVGIDYKFTWSCYDISSTRNLVDVSLEIKPKDIQASNEIVKIDSKKIEKALGNTLYGHIITRHERIWLTCAGAEYILRVLELNLEIDEEEDGLSGDFDDAYRGRIVPGTQIFVQKDMGEFEERFVLENVTPREAKKRPSNILDIYCNDGEYFPVKKRLLQPCIALTKSVLDKTESRLRIDVDVDCCTFDRVLLYLIAEAKGTEELSKYKFELEQCGLMLEAAKKLKIRGLQDICESMLGAYESRIREEGISWQEVVDRNENGETLLVIDGMVCDVTRWLPEHPGGNTIIPEQALNQDATVYFELYHASKESFLYLKQLYIGQMKGRLKYLVKVFRD
mmetsp:Transcript_29086/g.35945  ORF Transcript_29086/g.35945 Transcript_29086/m.35945 type:complete len:447 (+) Transcript_29086:237-1577(+)